MHKWIGLALVGMAVVGFAAERRLNAYQPRQDGVTRVRVAVAGWQWSALQGSDFDLERVFREFDARHPEIKVDLRLMPEGNEITLMLPWRAGATPFDLLLTTNNETVMRIIEGGFAEPLEDHLAPELEAGLLGEFLPGYLQCCRAVDPRTGEEHLYALPYLGELHSLNYHRDALAAHGLSERDLPHTWEEFERLARRLHDPEQMQYGMTFDLSTTFFCQNTYVPILSAFAGDAVDAQGRIDVTSREAAGTFELVKRWYREGLIPQGALTIYQSADDFRAGIAVMFANWQSRGAWAMRTMPEGEERIGIGPCPGSEEVGSLLAHYVGVIPKASPVPAEAARLLLEAIVYDLQPGVVKAGCMSPIKHIYDQHRPGYGQEVVPASIQRLRDLVDADFRVPAWMIPLRPTVERGYVIPDPLTWQRVSDIMGVEFQKYLREEIPAEEALGRAKRQIDALYE